MEPSDIQVLPPGETCRGSATDVGGVFERADSRLLPYALGARESGLADHVLFEARTRGMSPWFTRLMKESKASIWLMVAATVAIQSATGHELNLRRSSRLGVIYGPRRPHNTYGQEF